jgi:hypothetical protein
MYIDPGGPELDELARFRLPNGQSICIQIQEHAISEEQQQLLEASRQAISEQVSRGQSVDRVSLEAALEPRGYLYGQNELGTRFFVDISGNFLFDEASGGGVQDRGRAP